MNRNEWLHSVLRGKMNRLAEAHKGVFQDGWNADLVDCDCAAEI